MLWVGAGVKAGDGIGISQAGWQAGRVCVTGHVDNVKVRITGNAHGLQGGEEGSARAAE